MWRRTAILEQDPATLVARESIYKADDVFSRGDLIGAKNLYEKGFRVWRTVFDDKRWPDLIDDEILCANIVESIGRYRRVLERTDEEFPKDFVLKTLVDRYATRHGPPAGGPPGKPAPAKP
jgi:hypothetical protein